MPGMVCASCHAVLPDAARFCASCGCPAGSDALTMGASQAHIVEPVHHRRSHLIPLILGPMTSSAVLFAGDVFHPFDRFAVEHPGDRDVRHRGCRRCATPVRFAGLEPHHVAGANLLDRCTVALHASTIPRDDQR